MATIGTIRIGFATGIGQLKQQMDSASSILRAFDSTWSNLGGAVTVVSAAFNVVGNAARRATGLISGMVMAASDVEESLNLVRVQFGSASGIVESEAQRMADRFGIVRSEFLQGAGSIGVVVEAMGKGSEATARMSADLVKLAGDISSIRNLRFEDVLIGLRSGLGGESEPLKTLGIFVNEARVQQEAYAAGIAKVGEALTEGQKIQARYNLIMQQTVKAQGDLERTADGVANSIRSVEGRIENLRADIGGAFSTITQGVLAATLDQIQALAGGFQNLRPAIQQWAQTTIQHGGFVNEAIGKMGSAIAMLADGVGYLRQAFKTAQSTITASLSGMTAALIPFGVSLDAIMVGLTRQPSIIALKIAAASADLAVLAQEQRKTAELIEPTAIGDKIRSFFDGIRGRMDEIGRAGQDVLQQVAEGTKQVEAIRKDEPKLGGVLEFGSAEARSAILSAQIGMKDTAQEQTAENTERVANHTARMEASLSTLVGYFVGTQVAKL